MPGHFAEPVTIEDARPLGAGAELRVRLATGALDEAVLSDDDLGPLLDIEPQTHTAHAPADAERLRLLVESTRIRLAYAYDRQFAVSLSGIRTLPHQIEAVYRKMLPQPRLRFLLADDPGAGKTIMAGLLVKELKLREAIDRCLILVPAPLTIQWQDELLRFFGEPFQIIHSANDQQQLLNLWEREARSSRRSTTPSRTTSGNGSGGSVGTSSSSTKPTSAARTRSDRPAAATRWSARNATSSPSGSPSTATTCCC